MPNSSCNDAQPLNMPPMNIQAVDQIGAALSLASLRNQAIASNIAHRDTEGYQRLKAQFSEALGDVPFSAAARPEASGVPGHPVITQDGSTTVPSLEQDMVELSTNAMHFQALARVLSRYFSIEETIASGART